MARSSFDDFDIDNFDPYSDSDYNPYSLLEEDPNEEEEQAVVEDPQRTPTSADLEAQADALLAAAEAAEQAEIPEDTEFEMVSFGQEKEDVHADALERLDATPFSDRNPQGLLDAIARVQAANLDLWIRENGTAPGEDVKRNAIGGSDEEGRFVARFHGYVIKNSRNISRKYDLNFDWATDGEDAKQNARIAILKAVREFRHSETVSAEQNWKNFFGYLGRAMLTAVGRKHIENAYGLSEKDFYLRGDIKSARAVLLKALRGEPSELDLRLWVHLGTEAKNASRAGEIPLRERVAEELGAPSFEAADWGEVREVVLGRELPTRIATAMLREQAGPDPLASLETELIQKSRENLSTMLLRERFVEGDPEDLATCVNVWIETVHGFGAEMDLPVALRLTLDEEGGLESVDTLETNIYKLAPAIMRARHPQTPYPGDVMMLQREITDHLLDIEVATQLGNSPENPPLAEVVKFAVFSDQAARLGRRPGRDEVASQLISLAGDDVKQTLLRTLRDHTTEIDSLDQSVGRDGEGRTLGETVEGALSDSGQTPLDEDDLERFHHIGRDANRVRTPGPNGLLQRRLWALERGLSVTSRDTPVPLHMPFNATEIGLAHGFTRATSSNYRADIDPAVEGTEIIKDVEVPVRGPDGQEYPVTRTVRGTVLSHRRARLEQGRRGP